MKVVNPIAKPKAMQKCYFLLGMLLLVMSLVATSCITVNPPPTQATSLPVTSVQQVSLETITTPTTVTTSVTTPPNTSQVVILPATGTAYVVSDTSTIDDPQGLRDQNYSTQDFLNIWYQWDVTGTEKVISVGLVKFDLSSLEGKNIKSATLQLNSTGATFAQNVAVRLVDVSLVDGTWDPKTVTFNTKPTWSSGSIATASVYGAGVWYSWDVTASVAQQAKDGEVSYALGLDTMVDKNQEQVLFASSQVSAIAPRLVVTY